MKPFDRRLVRYARATRGYLAATAALGVLGVILVIAQASLLASAIARVVAGGADLAEIRGTLVLLAATVTGRAAVAWAQEVAAHRCSAAVKTDLRGQLLRHIARLGPAWLNGAGSARTADATPNTPDATPTGTAGASPRRAGEIATLTTRGLDALDAYFSRYLPQLILAALVPAAVLAWILPVDPVAGVTIMLTLPLIPIFMALVGLTTEQRNRRQFAQLSRLSRHLLEIIAGLPTLKAFGRAKAQADAIRQLTDEQRVLTMRTLRLAFLSSLVLELFATISVALVAVGIGLRVVSGSLDFQTALTVLILAPEAYLPLRQLGAHYHASAEGVAAATRVFDILETPVPREGTYVDVPHAPLVLDDVTVHYSDRPEPAVDHLTMRVDPGEVVALTGPSGCGKSTVLSLLLGFIQPSRGQILVGDGPRAVRLDDVNLEAWRSRIAYVPQRPYLFAGTVADNIRLGDPEATDDQVAHAARRAGLDVDVSTVVGEQGAGLSAGQRQRVALARAFLRDAPLVLLDEPTASLDDETEAAVITAVRRLAAGRTVVMAAHRPALLAAADRVVALSGSGAACEPAASPSTRSPAGTLDRPPALAHGGGR